MADFITLVVNDFAHFPFTRKALTTAKRLIVDVAATKVTTTSNTDIDFTHLSVLAKILNGENVIPMVNVNSHYDILKVVRFARELEVSDELIVEGFRGWTEHRRWIELWHSEYLYPLYLEMEELVDFGKFFRLHPEPFESLAKAIKLKYVLANPIMYMNMLMHYKNYKFETMFKENNDQVQERIDVLTKQRDAAWQLFMVNPHQPELLDYFTYTVTNYSTWDTKGISAAPEINPGDRTISTYEAARANLNKFSCGWLEKPVDPEYKGEFPFSSVVIAGGSTSKCVNSNFNANSKTARQSDLDIFIFGSDFAKRAGAFESVLRWFGNPPLKHTDRPIAFYGIRGSVVTVELRDVKRKFQIISINSSNPYEIIARFDLTHIQWCFWNGTFFGTPEACASSRERVTRYNNIKRLKTPRLIKALYNGYQIFKTDEATAELDITDLIANAKNDQLMKIIRDLHKGYYPQTDLDMDPEEERLHILSNIESDTGANLVSCEVEYVLNNVTISGNFENDYDSTLYSNFNANTIAKLPLGRRITTTIVKAKHGPVRLTTCMLDVINFVSSDAGIEITAAISKHLVGGEDEKFRDFLNTLEGNVFRMYRNAAVTKHILDENRNITFNVMRQKLDLQIQRGQSIIYNQQGKALDIETNLKPGDQIQVMFLIEIRMFPAERAVALLPLKFIKYVQYDPAKIAAINEADAKQDAELAKMTAQITLDSEIAYEDNIEN